MRSRLKLASQEERGAVMVIFAMSFVVLLGFMAIAVDGAHAFVERRDSQATVDVDVRLRAAG